MIRTDHFLISRRLYAVDLSSLRTAEPSDAWVTAVWFGRKQGVARACIGTLWDIQRPLPTDAVAFLARHDDGRYGGDCDGRWDGERYWGAQEPEAIAAHLAILRPMLANFPALPDGYDGWWKF